MKGAQPPRLVNSSDLANKAVTTEITSNDSNTPQDETTEGKCADVKVDAQRRGSSSRLKSQKKGRTEYTVE